MKPFKGTVSIKTNSEIKSQNIIILDKKIINFDIKEMQKVEITKKETKFKTSLTTKNNGRQNIRELSHSQ